MTELRLFDVEVGTAAYRSEAHCAVACELYGAGRPADALLQSARPMTDVFPWLETELRSSHEALNAFMRAVAAIGAGIRGSVKPRALRRTLKDVVAAREALVSDAVGELASASSFESSVAIALLDAATSEYAAAVDAENLGGYLSAYGLVRIGSDLIASAAGRKRSEIEEDLGTLHSGFPSAEPPPQLVRPESLQTILERLTRFSRDRLGARALEASLSDSLQKVGQLVDDVVDSYERGERALAARLAASLFVRNFDPIRSALAELDETAADELTELLSVRLRRAINDGVSPEEVSLLGAAAHEKLGALEQSKHNH